MPACRLCPHFDADGPQCQLAKMDMSQWPRPLEWWEKKRTLRACMLAVLFKHLPHIAGDVLEVGYGRSGVTRRAVRKTRRARWYGVDPKGNHLPQHGSFKGKVDHMPFRDQQFDWVLAFETMEHWHEFRTRHEDGLGEIFRVLKPGGKLVATVPIHLHGHDVFYFGRIEEIERLFRLHPWRSVTFTDWRRNYAPLPQLTMWEAERGADRLRSETSGTASCWKLEIVAEK